MECIFDGYFDSSINPFDPCHYGLCTTSGLQNNSETIPNE